MTDRERAVEGELEPLSGGAAEIMFREDRKAKLIAGTPGGRCSR